MRHGLERHPPHLFPIHGRLRFLDADFPERNPTSRWLSELLSAAWRQYRFEFVYDLSDEWKHKMVLENITAPEPGVTYPRCTTGGGDGRLPLSMLCL
jgi:hypothetical protein